MSQQSTIQEELNQINAQYRELDFQVRKEKKYYLIEDYNGVFDKEWTHEEMTAKQLLKQLHQSLDRKVKLQSDGTILVYPQKTIPIFLILLIAGLLIGILGFLIYLFFRPQSSGIISDKLISPFQTKIELPVKTEEPVEMTEYQGFGEIDVNAKEHNVYLINSENNTVLMQFDIYEDGEMLYSSGLISPGMMETFDAYNALSSGFHTLTYQISTYEEDTKVLCMAGVLQQQDVNVVK